VRAGGDYESLEGKTSVQVAKRECERVVVRGEEEAGLSLGEKRR